MQLRSVINIAHRFNPRPPTNKNLMLPSLRLRFSPTHGLIRTIPLIKMPPIKSKALINVDLGEAYGNFKGGPDDELFPFIDQANIACGFQYAPLFLKKKRRKKGITTCLAAYKLTSVL